MLCNKKFLIILKNTIEKTKDGLYCYNFALDNLSKLSDLLWWNEYFHTDFLL